MAKRLLKFTIKGNFLGNSLEESLKVFHHTENGNRNLLKVYNKLSFIQALKGLVSVCLLIKTTVILF